jgi:hypothetical protein
MTPYNTHIFVLSERALPREAALSDANRGSARERSRQRICTRRNRRQRATRESRDVHLRNSSTDSSKNRHRSFTFSLRLRLVARSWQRHPTRPRARHGGASCTRQRSWPSCHRPSASSLPPTSPLVSPAALCQDPRKQRRKPAPPPSPSPQPEPPALAPTPAGYPRARGRRRLARRARGPRGPKSQSAGRGCVRGRSGSRSAGPRPRS